VTLILYPERPSSTGDDVAMRQARDGRTEPSGPTIAPRPLSTAESRSLADVIDDLLGVFGGRLVPFTVLATVRSCRRELDILGGPPGYAAVEELARRRLTALLATPCRFAQRHTGDCQPTPRLGDVATGPDPSVECPSDSDTTSPAGSTQ
jgi:hypothetical protein